MWVVSDLRPLTEANHVIVDQLSKHSRITSRGNHVAFRGRLQYGDEFY